MGNEVGSQYQLAAEILLLQRDLDTERRMCGAWRERAYISEYLREWLRICQDNPEGHAEFYDEAARLIFGESVSKE